MVQVSSKGRIYLGMCKGHITIKKNYAYRAGFDENLVFLGWCRLRALVSPSIFWGDKSKHLESLVEF